MTDELDEMGEALERECFTDEMRAEAERGQRRREIAQSERVVREAREEELRDADWSPPRLDRFLTPEQGREQF